MSLIRPIGTEMHDEWQLAQLQEDLLAAVQRADCSALSEMLAADFSVINPVGKVLTRDEALDAIAVREDHDRIVSIKVRDVRVRVFGDVAVVTAAGSSDPDANAFRYTTVWVFSTERWQAVSHQSTMIFETPD